MERTFNQSHNWGTFWFCSILQPSLFVVERALLCCCDSLIGVTLEFVVHITNMEVWENKKMVFLFFFLTISLVEMFASK